MSRNRHSDITYPKMKNEQFCSLRVGRLISCAENKVQYFQVDRHVCARGKIYEMFPKGLFSKKKRVSDSTDRVTSFDKRI